MTLEDYIMTPSSPPPAAPSGQTPAAAPSNRRRILIAIGLAILGLVICAALFFAARALLTRPGAQPTATVQPTSAPPTSAAPTATPAQPTATAQPVGQPDYGQPPQPYIGHPSWYQETGIGQTKNWTIPVEADNVLVVGGFKVDGRDGGVYKAWFGGQTVTVSVTDGFALVIAKEWARDEFCFRVNQAKEFGWAHKYVEPLPGWTACQ